MSSKLHLSIDPDLSDDLFFRPLLEIAQEEECPEFDLETLDVDQVVLVVCRGENLAQTRKRFRYYRYAWFALVQESLDESLIQGEQDQIFIFTPGQEELFRTVLNQLKQLAQAKRSALLRTEGNRDLQKLIFEAGRHLDWLVHGHRLDLGVSGQGREKLWQELNQFLILRRRIYQYTSLEDGIKELGPLLKDYGALAVELHSSKSVFEREDRQMRRLILPHPALGENGSLHFDYAGAFDSQKALYFYLFYLELGKFALRGQGHLDTFFDNSLWELAFSAIKRPIVLISKMGDILVHNNEFSRLKILPKECLALNSGQQIELAQQFWQVSRIPVALNATTANLIVFETYGQNENLLGGLSSSELGIISGSLAHELNNPVGGILAALTLLELEEEWDQEGRTNLEEMRSSARRCKSLIEIFLGFSQVSPASLDRLEQRVAIEQALNLLRFRMIESQTRIEVLESLQHEPFQKIVNSSVMAMIFYLLLSEVLTHYSQLQLLQTGTNKGGRTLGLSFYESEQSLTLHFHEEWSTYEGIEAPRLLTHLLSLEGLTLEREKNNIRLHRVSLI